MAVLAFLKLLGCLGLLMYGMKLMSEGLQKMAGSQLRHILDTLTSNRFTSLLTGAVITAIVLSSTATSVMTVSFVHAGMLSLIQGISVIMGSSFGNTLIAWIMAAEFNYSISNYIYPFFILAIWFTYSRSYRSWGESLFGMCFMFLGLGLLYRFAGEMNLPGNPDLVRFFAYADNSTTAYLICLVIGALLTMLVQSSAALMATSMILCSTGVLSIYAGVAFVMGENIGRAVTTYRAAASASPPARRLGVAQLLFNFFGVAWAFCLMPFFVDTICLWVGYDPLPTAPKHTNLAYVLAAFHTCFNLCNVLFFIWLVKPLERLLCDLIQPNKKEEEEDFELRYISCGILTTAELSVLEAKKEIDNYSKMTFKMFSQVRFLATITQDAEFNQLFTQIEKHESMSDKMEVEIADYLNQLSNDRLSSDTKNEIRCMLREISEIESIGDSCLNIAHTLNRKYHQKGYFTKKQMEHMHQMYQLTEQALVEMNRLLTGKHVSKEAHASYYIENEINNFRKQLRSLNIIDVNNHEYSYQIGTMYMDIINECEKLADYILNVVEAHTSTYAKEL